MENSSKNCLIENRDYSLEKVDCPYCGSKDFDLYIKKAKELYNGLDAWFDVVKCLRCGHYLTNPRPTQETIGCFYPDTANYYQPKIDQKKKNKSESVFFKSILANHFGYDCQYLPKAVTVIPSFFMHRKLLLSHVPRFVHEGKLLDIGCAWGNYLSKMKELGWRVEGVELNESAANSARALVGANVHVGSLDNFECPDNVFDVIHMSMVLEHLHNPISALERIHNILKPNGQFILSVPDISGFEAKLFHERAYTLQVPQHLSHFTPETIKKFLDKAGFKTEKIIHQRTKSDFIKSAAYLNDGWKKSFWLSPLMKKVILGPFVTILSLVGKTSRMSVYARKKDEH